LAAPCAGSASSRLCARQSRQIGRTGARSDREERGDVQQAP
jgi:hypothetical protein